MRCAPILFAVAVLLVPLPVVPADGGADADVAVRPEAHPSIVIDGDADFEMDSNGVRDGDGSPERPYRIANLAIAQSRGTGIRLVNTTAHVVIEDVVVIGFLGFPMAIAECPVDSHACDGPHGIQLVGVENVTLRRVKIIQETWGIKIRSSTSVRIEDSEIGPLRATGTGISTVGIDVLFSGDVAIQNVTFRNTPLAALAIRASAGVTIEDSTFVGNTTVQLTGDRAGVAFHRNAFVNTTVLMAFGNGVGVSFVENDFLRSRIEDGTAFDRTHSVFLCGNRFQGVTASSGAVRLLRSTGVTAIRNEFRNNSGGFDAGSVGLPVSPIVFEENLIRNTTGRGARITALGSVIRNNDFAENPTGIFIGFASNATSNWWGSEDGPSGLGTGNGTFLGAPNVTFSPWLTSPPALDFDCGEPDTRGAQVVPQFVAEASTSASAQAGPAHAGVEGEAGAEREIPV